MQKNYYIQKDPKFDNAKMKAYIDLYTDTLG